MAIPKRFQLAPLSSELVETMCGICSQIGRQLEVEQNAENLIARWHELGARPTEPYEFTNYDSYTDQGEFVRSKLTASAQLAEDLTYREALAVLVAVVEVGDLKDHEIDYYLSWLDAQFTGAEIGDLIYWPDHWFKDASLFRDADGKFKPNATLSNEQILGYAIKKSGRMLPDAPSNVPLPFPMPS